MKTRVHTYNELHFHRKTKGKILFGFVLLFLSMSSVLFSQNVGISITGATPSQNAILDLNTGNSNKYGLIIPNVNLAALTQWSAPMATPCTSKDSGIMVFNTNSAVGNGVGYYYWNTTAGTWVSLLGINSFSTCAGALSGYIPYFISSTEICNSIIYQSGANKIGVNTTTPQNMLDVNGAMAVGSYAGTVTVPANGVAVSGQVGVGNSSPNASAALDLTNATSNLGFLAPRLSATQIVAMSYPVAIGLIVFNTTTGCLEFNSTGTNTGWNDIMCPCLGAPATPGSIVGDQTICASGTYTYSVAAVSGAGSYIWTVPVNIGTIASGQGTNTIMITTPNNVYGLGNSGSYNTITVSASNNCGTSAVSTYGVQVVPDHGTEVFNMEEANQTWVVPPCVTQVTVKLWGAGGGGSYAANPVYSASGSGGYVSGTMAVTPEATYTVIVGQGGLYGQQEPYGINYGGGGLGGNAASTFCGEGGGRSAIQQVSGVDYVTAGGGGGAGLGFNTLGTLTSGYGAGGAGGGNTGGTAGTDYTATLATGGTQVSGGTTGNYLGWVGTNGSSQTGGTGGTRNEYGGGGGGGYYGGGGGSGSIGGGGGGGSSYVTNLTGVVTNTQGSSSASCNCLTTNNPPNTVDPNYVPGIGVGGYNTSEPFCGGPGEVVITW